MNRISLFWQFSLTYFLIIALSLVTAFWYTSRSIRDFHLRETRHDLRARAELFKAHLAPSLLADAPAHVDALCKRLGTASGSRLTVVQVDGTVVGDSDEDPATMENHADRPELQDAIQSGFGASIRHSDTIGQDMMYVALPLREDDGVYGAVRVSLPMDSVGQAIAEIYSKVILIGLGIIALSILLAVLTARRITRPLTELRDGVAAFGRGELARKLPVPESEELAVLAQAMNRMARELDVRIAAILEQRNEQQAVLASMVEGVIAIDPEERILQLNAAAERILERRTETIVGRFVQEVIRNPDLQKFIRDCLAADGPVEADISWTHEGEDRFFQARGSTLQSARGEQVGVLIVLNEVTRLYRLERVRRDFVANVSHELRTPITSIRGFAETLLDEPAHDPERVKHFAGIIARQASRLNAIIEDLLSLSRIDQQAEGAESVETVLCDLRDIVADAVENCRILAEPKAIDLAVECAPGVPIQANADLLIQAIGNLIENAIKYSPDQTEVHIVCESVPEAVRVRVIDQGPGIPRDHQARLFERFYRVDKARSRDLGGTGLGLAIVKHVVLAHGGSVEVKSTPGTGSEFILTLPR